MFLLFEKDTVVIIISRSTYFCRNNSSFGRFRNCDGRNLHNDMPVILRKMKIRGGPWHNKAVMWSGLRPTAKKIPVI